MFGNPNGGTAYPLLLEWMGAVGSHDPDKVLSLYSRDAVLVPTYGTSVLVGHAQLRSYFDKFLALPGLRGKIDCFVVQEAQGKLVVSGIYTFSTQDHAAADPAFTRARFTYVFAKVGGRWKIMTHHSSEMPDPI